MTVSTFGLMLPCEALHHRAYDPARAASDARPEQALLLLSRALLRRVGHALASGRALFLTVVSSYDPQTACQGNSPRAPDGASSTGFCHRDTEAQRIRRRKEEVLREVGMAKPPSNIPSSSFIESLCLLSLVANLSVINADRAVTVALLPTSLHAASPEILRPRAANNVKGVAMKLRTPPP